MNPWIALLLAGLLEVVWAAGLKQVSWVRPQALSWVLPALGASFGLLAFAAQKLPIGTAYAVWTGIGAVGAVLAGVWLYNEPVNAARLGFCGLIIIGVVGLRFVSE